MKKYLILFIAIISFNVSFAQDPLNLDSIKANVTDKASPFFYEKLVYQFNFNPGTIGLEEAKHLYYGKTYANYKVPFSTQQEISRAELNDLIKGKKYDEAIFEGEKMIRNSPADIEVLGLLMYSLLQTDKKDEDLQYLRGYQFQKLIETVKRNKSGTDKKPIYTVTSIPDEYVIAGILNLDLKNFTRRTTYNKIGALDMWKNGKQKIIFQVVYDVEAP
ncbi:DUF4919 domain-containing protein [Frigoriflavimonas asaccharolytica]|uniref:DUF4919 domain-containing protein n=1 Tax=Frigoriflavimonas asaccharolytica TaxID=2735899 RepID=A0A8J8G509_9FLAO|nr:DUF4919 domain-containing protein [Frigoriflavimonas asaccharolytica]NRS91374.1 hypothetical protein [Frigoriflavimonas asaccharolytica]